MIYWICFNIRARQKWIGLGLIIVEAEWWEASGFSTFAHILNFPLWLYSEVIWTTVGWHVERMPYKSRRWRGRTSPLTGVSTALKGKKEEDSQCLRKQARKFQTVVCSIANGVDRVELELAWWEKVPVAWPMTWVGSLCPYDGRREPTPRVVLWPAYTCMTGMSTHTPCLPTHKQK